MPPQQEMFIFIVMTTVMVQVHAEDGIQITAIQDII